MEINKPVQEKNLADVKINTPQEDAALLDAIFSAYPDVFFLLDANGMILDQRVGNLAALYKPPANLPGAAIQDVVAPDVGVKLVQAIHQVLDDSKINIFEYRSKINDKERCFEARLAGTVSGTIALMIREVTEREYSVTRIQQQAQQLSALHTIDAAISASFDIKIPMAVILQQTLNQLGVDAADVRLLNPVTHMLEFAAGQGFRLNSPHQSSIMLGQGIAGEAALKRRIISVSDLKHRSSGELNSSRFLEEGFTSYFAVPLIAKGEIKGVLEIFNREPMNPGGDWLEFLNMLASQAAVAIESATLFQNFQRANSELSMAYDAVIESWSQALELSGRESKEHTHRVVELATELAELLGLKDKEITELQRGARLHDIGKMAIPEAIMQKAEPLTENEWKIVHQHPQIAYELLSPIKYLAAALDIPHYHHENWDGSGYPTGLREEQIPFSVRIFSVVHTYHALTKSRPYRARCSQEKALEYIKEQANRKFDPNIVQTFLKMMERKRGED